MEDELDEFIKKSGIFVTDLEQIVDIIYNSNQVFLYDTVAISSHEGVFHHHEKTLLRHFEKNEYPIIITDTIAKEMKLLGSVTNRYLTYLEQFSTLLYIKEEDFFNLITYDVGIHKARKLYLDASIKAFSDFQPLKNSIVEIEKNSKSTSEICVLPEFQSFFQKYSNKNKGEISLLWLSIIIGIISPKVRVNFLGIDNDLYNYVTRCYFTNTYDTSNKNPRLIGILSNDTLIQALHNIPTVMHEDFLTYLHLYRQDQSRRVIYFEIVNGLKGHQVEMKSFTNDEIKKLIVEKGIEIVY